MSEEMKDPSSMHEITTLRMKFKDTTQKYAVKWYVYERHDYDLVRKYSKIPKHRYNLKVRSGWLTLTADGLFYVSNEPWLPRTRKRVFANRTAPGAFSIFDRNVVAWRFLREKAPDLSRTKLTL